MTTTLERTRVQPIPFSRLLRVEARKSLDTRSARWLLVLTAVVSLGVGCIPVCVPDDADQSLAAYASAASTGFALLLPVLVIMLVTTEWTQRTAMTTFALEPRRSRVLWAKAGVTVLLGLAATAITLGFAFGYLALSSSLGRDVEWGMSGGEAAGLPLMLVLGVVGAFAFATLLHNTAAAIVATFGVPTAVGILGALLKGATKWIDIGQASTWVMDGEWGGHLGPILTSHALFLGLPLVLGWGRTLRREVG